MPVDDVTPGGFLDKFPALGRLGSAHRKRPIPLVHQLSASECAAACLTMVLGYHGRGTRMEEVREVVGADSSGTSAITLINAAKQFGLRGRGVRIEVEDLEYLDKASILHWDFNHYVVFARLRRNSVEILDPATGRRSVPMEQFRRSFTGVALVLEPAEDFEPAALESAGVWRYVRRTLAHTGLWSRILITSVLAQLFSLAVPILTGALVDRVVPRQDYHLLLVLGAGLLSLVVFQFLTSFIRSHLLLHWRTYAEARLSLGFMDHLVSLPYSFFQQRTAGDLSMRLNSNTVVREILTAGALSTMLDGSMTSLYLLILFAVAPPIGALAMALGAAQLAVYLLSRTRQRELMSENLQKQARSHGYQLEILAGIETLKSMGAEERAVEHWSDLLVDLLNVTLMRGRLDAAVDSTLSALRLASPLLILGFGGLLVLEGSLTLGTMLALSALAGGFLLPLANLVSTATQFQLLRSYLERINDVLRHPPEQDKSQVRPAGRLRGGIRLEQLSFRYSPAAAMAVRDVTVEIQPGEFLAIVGRTGAGKTTLAGLMVGLYSPASGRVQFDGIDLAALDVRSVRRQIGIVTQRPYLFGATIRQNISLADPAIPLESVMEAARRARIHDDILALPLGYDTLLADGGASLSGGQRQKIALARALVRHPAILLLDEATSSLDAIAEMEIQRELASLHVTIIVIAHRLSTIAAADRILVMEGGRIAEQGSHQELLALSGLYAALVAAQLEPQS